MNAVDWIVFVVVGAAVLALLLPILAGIIDTLFGTSLLPWLDRFPEALKRGR